MKGIVSGWVQQRLLHHFKNNTSKIAINDCTGDSHNNYKYEELFHQVNQIAQQIKHLNGERALLLLPGDSSFIFSFLACVMTGITAVPVNLPGVKRLNRVKATLDHIINDCEPNLILALSLTQGEIEKFGWHEDRDVIYIDKLPSSALILSDSEISPPEGPVMLQYSSGSTGRPKAVCNYDDNIYHQYQIMQKVAPDLKQIHTANWLPFYHDLGLFYGLMFPLLSGGSCSFIRPSQFSADPIKWLSIIEQYQATITAAPDFAYKLCVDTIPEAEASRLNLSSLRVAMNAAEPIRVTTINVFSEHFKSSGFEPTMFLPAYGMAEATLFISHKPIDTPVVITSFNEDKLADGLVEELVNGRELVSSGSQFSSWQVEIVDPQTGVICTEGQVGEVWVHGDSVAKGYWNQLSLSQETFKARTSLSGNKFEYLRTGDLAFLWKGELYICGRCKDVIIVSGENHMPNDIETTIEQGVSEVEVGGACFVQDTDSGEIYGICEIHRHTPNDRLLKIANKIKSLVAKNHQLPLSQVALLAKGSLKKTSSGKIRRRLMLDELQSNRLKSLFVSSQSDHLEFATSISDYLRLSLKALIGLENFDEKQGFSDLGLTSLLATQWCAQISAQFGFSISPIQLFAYPNLAAFSQFIEQARQKECPVSDRYKEKVRNQDVAIVAISSRLPKQQSNHWCDYASWLAKGESALQLIDSQLRNFDLPIGDIENIDGFDANFFSISSREACLLDPQQRWLMEASWHLFEQAGWLPSQLSGLPLGIFIGQGSQDYGDLLAKQEDPNLTKSYLVTGTSRSGSSGRIAKYFGTSGPAITLDTACSSSLVAMDMAVQNIQSGRCESAISGGVNLLLSAQVEQALQKAGMLSPKGRCATFSEDADGYARAEGLGLLLLKDYDAALRDGDPILAVIEATGVAQDGESSSLTAPNPLAQQALLRGVLERSGRSINDIDAIEMHGTGTQLGDPIELSAIDGVYQDRIKPLYLTAGKAQFGHLESAAGVAGVIRAVAQMHAQMLFPHPSFNAINLQLEPWIDRYVFSRESCVTPIKRMGVSAFSFTGTLAHAIIRHHPSEHNAYVKALPLIGYFPLSAIHIDSLRQSANNWVTTLQQQGDIAIELLHAWLCKREHLLPIRTCVQYCDVDDLIIQLTKIAQGEVLPTISASSGIEQWCNGHDYNWSMHCEKAKYSVATMLALPLYPFKHEKYWVEVANTNHIINTDVSVSSITLPVDSQQFLVDWTCDALGIEGQDIELSDDLINLGLDSLQMMDLVDEAKKCGVALELARMYENPTLSAWIELWDLPEVNEKEFVQDLIISNEEPLSTEALLTKPFELTSVQQAYWQGRNASQILGGVACQVYLELDSDWVDSDRLQLALGKLNLRHSMLRMRMNLDGLGCITQECAPCIAVYDWRNLDSEIASEKQANLRHQLEAQVLDLENESGFSVTLSHSQSGSRLHFNIDMVIADALSLQILLDDFAQFYVQVDSNEDVVPTLHFPQYLAALRSENQREVDRQYWLEQLPELPAAPQLPLAVRPEDLEQTEFVHREWHLAAEQWAAFQQACRQHRITPSMMLANCYAEILRGWSDNKEFCLNLTIFNRRHTSMDVSDVVADFTTLMLLACKESGQSNILDNASALNRLFMANLDHCDFDAISLLRELSQQRGVQATMPVVFTSNLGNDFLADSCLGEMNYIVSQTPQVWIDCQVMERDGCLVVSWDTVDALFPEDLIEQMFASMGRLISQISMQPQLLQQPVQAFITADERHKRQSLNSSDLISFNPRTLHTQFFEWAEYQPESIAVISNRRSVTYQQLSDESRELALRLQNQGVSAGDCVAVFLPKGSQQVVAVLAVHLLGACYVPLDTEQPIARLQQIIEQARPQCVVVDNDSMRLIETAGEDITWSLVNVDTKANLLISKAQFASVSPQDVAYIIYTSGSTGVPKGVVTSHQAAANTIDDINQRYQLDHRSRTFALSALNFDLSVFDIFGPLSVGGSLVYPEQSERKEAKAWLSIIHEYQVTVWNSVPALFEMLLIAAENDLRQLPKSLSNVLVSGDWVGLDLQPRLLVLDSSIKLTALGGATEAAIWSNAYDVTSVDEHWTSIPYGHALSNQCYRVMDSSGRDCPDWVAGELWIGGEGVALGYFDDPERTAAQFVNHHGNTFYRTGDMGRFWSNGIVEFIGRKDTQIKLNGFRIELGDIEHTAEQFVGVQKAVALLVDKPQKHIQLFVSAHQGSDLEIEKDSDVQLRKSEIAQPVMDSVADFHQLELAIVSHVIRQVLRQAISASGLEQNASMTSSQWLQTLNVTKRYHALFEHWLQLLVETKQWHDSHGCLQQDCAAIDPLSTCRDEIENMPDLSAILTALESRVDWYVDLLKGNTSELELLDDPILTPEALVFSQPEFAQLEQYLVETIAGLSHQLARPVKVVELNGRAGRLASQLLNQCDATQVEYCVVEQAKSVLDQAKFRLSGYGEHARACGLDDVLKHDADLVISNNALHRFSNVVEGVDKLSTLLAPSGHFIVLEAQALSPLALLTVTLMQPEALTQNSEQSPYNDLRKGNNSPLLTMPQWQECISASQLKLNPVSAINDKGMLVITGRQIDTVVMTDISMLSSWLSLQLPSYMLPQYISFCSSMPLTSNGKIDRNHLRLSAVDVSAVVQSDKHDCITDNEKCVARIWQQVLGVAPSRDDNFFLLGGDSLHATRIVAALEEKGGSGVKLADVFSRPVLSDFARYIALGAQEPSSCVALMHDESARYQPFPLTDVQQAYIIGRKEGFVMGGVGTHFYSEFAVEDLDGIRLEHALMRLIERHDTLRIVFDEQGQQTCLASAPYCPLDVVSCAEEQWEAVAQEQREALSQKVLDPSVWPLFHLTFIESPSGNKRLCIGLDNVILDGLSMRIFFAELGILYRDLDAKLPELGVTFRDYQQQVYSQGEVESQKIAQDYWIARLPNLPDAPRLPLITEPNQLDKPRFVRWQSSVPKETWQRLTEKARQHAITPSCLLLNCYAQVLAKWSESSSHCINVTLFDRKPVHKNIQHIMGDFTSLLLLETTQSAGESWLESAERLQQQLWQDLEHTDVSAVWVMRELSKLKELSDLSMPVVFTSALGADTSLDESSELGISRSIWGVSQTPQVWIDHQVFEQDGILHFNWDVVEALFPEGLVDTMFSAYCELLTQLSQHDWLEPCPICLPEDQQKVRAAINNTKVAQPSRTMHMSVYEQMQATPNAVALIASGKHYSYHQLHQKVSQAAYQLKQSGVENGDCVGVMLPRSVEQVVSVLAIQWIGAAYVPLAIDWPRNRVESVLQQAGIKLLLCGADQQLTYGCKLLNVETFRDSNDALFEPLHSDLDELAYVIFTSGSTGVPKGVEITHGSAMNTIDAVNRQHCINAEDSVLALSALYFDLSVYDIFGLLSVGGKVVLINEEQNRDVNVWLDLVQSHGITLWNTVPALLEMALIGDEAQSSQAALASLRCVMLSGDWINLELPERLQLCNVSAKFVAMGGATEASIWSNYCVIDQVKEGWRSIPYGYPLPNQVFRVVSDTNGDCPDWVAGELWIGGDGVAKGYIGNSDLTQQQFCEHSGRRWYRTGDMGRYWPDGTLEFLGRRDHQVKVAGLRIELGEIVRALKACHPIQDAIVMIEHHSTRPKIQAYLLSTAAIELTDIQQQLLNILPSYSMPDGYAVLREWPLTNNGKVDRNTLKTFELSNVSESEFVAPTTDEELVLTQVMQQVLGIDTPIGINDNFFALGGDSFVAIQLATRLQQHGMSLPLHAVFNLQTISRIALALKTSKEEINEVDFEEGSL
ncbi:non-ribosomal peptide synthetase [Photobacterium sanguinicancri]|uniref:Amino acid adenylation domain-containing protein n=1 Tax=Photobacterium sanguinicancri TaxID=875932 RepID=A0AAW7Y898_9GAMM|nr:non-ribosomal peptide synthetase [Photobacterium sanguinicancri]MDO6544752.1 amino acid adenylation domain-containing protein [Photobacterium sanguinicancri]